jgi:hypothetical protein
MRWREDEILVRSGAIFGNNENNFWAFSLFPKNAHNCSLKVVST